MLSNLRQSLCLKLQPVAVWKGNALPPEVVETGGTGGCLIPALEKAAKGTPTVFSQETVGCPGGRQGLGLTRQAMEGMDRFLSTGTETRPGMAYKKDPAMAACYLKTLPASQPARYVAFYPLDQLPEGLTPTAVIFLVNAHQLSALATLANYDQADGRGVELRFGAGCAQAVLYSLCHAEAGEDVCTIGLTDPSARIHLEQGELLSFSVPYRRCLTMEAQAAESFLVKGVWRQIQKELCSSPTAPLP